MKKISPKSKHNYTPKSLVPESEVIQPVFAGAEQSVQKKSLNKKLMVIGIGAAVLVLLVALVATLVVNQKNKSVTRDDPTTQPGPGTALPDDYSLLQGDEIRQKLQRDTGLDAEQLKGQTLTAQSFEDFDQAYAVAQAMYGLEYYDKALEAYKIAEQKLPEDIDYLFYLNYAGAADAKGERALGTQLLEKAKEAVANSSLSKEMKASIAQDLDAKIQLRKVQ